MRWLDTLRMRFEMLLHRGRAGRRLDAELEFHLDQQTAENVAAGMDPGEARYAALRSFGNPAALRDQARASWSWNRLETLWQDVRFALRQLRISSGFTVTAVLTLALGIGATTGIFSLTRALLFDPLPVPDPASLVRISLVVNSPGGAVPNLPLNTFMIDSLRRHATTLSGIFGWSPYFFVLQQDNGLHTYDGAMVSGNTFQVLALRPAAGRLLTPDDDRPGGGPDGWAAVLSYRFWQEHFGSAPSIIGKHLILSDHSVTVVGVAPRGFEGVVVGAQPDFFLPLEYEPVLRGAGSQLRRRGSVWLIAWARLRPGVHFAAAAAQIRALFRPVVEEVLPPNLLNTPLVEHSGFAVESGATGWSGLRSTYIRPLLVLQILTGVVLLVGCVNLAGLCLARATAREHEFAIRTALGAARARLMQQILVESLLLACAGGALAVAFAWFTADWLLRFLNNKEAASALAVHPDAVLLAVTAVGALLCALLFGSVPAWLASHFPLEPALRNSGRSQTHGARNHFVVRRMFLPAQLALTLGLVSVAAMLGATVIHLRDGALGFHPGNILLANTDFERLPQKGEALVHLYRRMIDRMAHMPGVDHVSVAENTPLSGNSFLGAFSSDESPEPASNPFRFETNVIGANYFATLGTPILAGRDFTGTDADADAGTCILNWTAMNMLFPMMPALGRTIDRRLSNMGTGTVTTETCRVIAIVGDTRYVNLRSAPPPVVYLPLTAASDHLYSLTFVIHADTLADAGAAYRTALHEFAPASPDTNPTSLGEQVDESMARESLLSTLSRFFALLTLLLSGVGIYGLTTSWVARRTSEIGVRMALGATRAGIVSLVLRQVVALLALGVLAGAGLAFVGGRAIHTFLYEVSPASPGLILLAVLLLALAALAAAWLPALRAASIDPTEALRTE
ncbi:MAG TPA: ABC transporter permease [Acidobacteriaceae bacterium]|nr:ABC transporter permease [Acidobacteriaceae bacterium]